MFRTLLLATLAASTSFACTLENAEPTGEGPVATDEGAPLAIGGADLTGTIKLSTTRQRFDFVLTENDSRTCASFTKVTASGSWRGFSTFPAAPWAISSKRCAAVYTPNVYGGTATIDQLGLNCREFQTARERWCSNYGNTCSSTSLQVMRPAAKTSMAATDIPSDCPVEPRDIGPVIEGTMYARTYTGGCTSCGTISDGLLYLNSPNPQGFVTYDIGGTPYIIGFSGITGPVTYNLGSWASGPVMVSY